MGKLFLSIGLLLFAMTTTAQKGSFGIINYTVPEGYQLEKADDVLTYYKQDKNTGAVCIFFVYKLMEAKGDTKECFDYYWENLVQKPNNVTVAATMQPEATTKGWHFLLGNANYADKGITNVAMQLTLNGENKMQNVLIISNSDVYKKDIEDFIANADVLRDAGNENPVLQKSDVSSAANKSFDVTIPPSWTMNTSGGKLMLEKNSTSGKNVIEFMNFIKSSGDLEKDMAHIFFEVFDGWELRIPENSLWKEAELQKGLTCQGVNYYMLSTSIKKKDPNSFDVIKATVLLIQAGDKVAIINATDNILGSEVEMALNFLLFNLKIKGIAGKNIGYKDQLIGTWVFGSGMYGNTLNAATSYTVAGKYFVLVQSTTTVGYNYYNDLIKNKQFKSEGVFGFNGNVLERKVSSGSTSKYFIRFYSRKYGDFEWGNCMSQYDYNYDKEKISSVLSFKKI